MFWIYFLYPHSFQQFYIEIVMALTKKEQEFVDKLGKRIVELRKEANMKQIELATRINIEDSALRRIESGRTNPTVKTLLEIAAGLDIDIRELFNF